MVRAKMRCIEKNGRCDSDEKIAAENTITTIRLQPVHSDCPENKEWSKWTPSGEVTLQVTNPKAVEQFVLGRAYWVDFTPVE